VHHLTSLISGLAGSGGLLLALARGVFVAGLLSAFGASLFLDGILPRAATPPVRGESEAVATGCWRLVRASVATALLALLGWLWLEAADMSDAETVRGVLAAIPDVLSGTSFGHLLLAQAGTLLAALWLAVRQGAPWRCALTLATGLAIVLQAAHSHAYAMEHGPSLLLASQALHVMAAGAWLGGLVPLLILLRGATDAVTTQALRSFSNLAALCVIFLAATATIQGWHLAGGFTGLTGTPYGWILLLKTALFGTLVGLGALNRVRLAPALVGGDGPAPRQALIRTIAVETVLGLLVVFAASGLSGLEPGMHAVNHALT
jgi:copper resistance protein D